MERAQTVPDLSFDRPGCTRNVIRVLTVALGVVLGGCGGNGGTQPLATTPVVINAAQPPAGAQGKPYVGFTFTASGGSAPFSWTVTGGALPVGLSLGTNGSLAGTPTGVGSER